MRINRVKLISVMAEKDVTATKLIEDTGLSIGTISRIRSGCTCTEKTAHALAKGLGVSLDCLLDKKEA